MISACRYFRNHIQDCMTYMSFEPYQADPDMCNRLTHDNFESKYYEYIMLYVDDCLVVIHQPDVVLDKLRKYLTFKPSSVGTPIAIGPKCRERIFKARLIVTGRCQCSHSSWVLCPECDEKDAKLYIFLIGVLFLDRRDRENRYCGRGVDAIISLYDAT